MDLFSIFKDLISIVSSQEINVLGMFVLFCFVLQDNVYSCYERMQEIEERKRMTPPESAGDIQPAVASGSGVKRRLSFDDSDQTSPVKRMRRL